MICDLCKKEIIEATDQYTCVQDWKCKEKKTEMWCHYACFVKAMNKELTELQTAAKKILNNAGGVLNKMIPKQYKI